MPGDERGRVTDATVIICTRDRAGSLARTLESVLADRSSALREVVVVDNGSTDTTPQVIAAASARAPFKVTRVVEARPGLSRARNVGVRHARGEILIFTDDDVAVHDGWTDALVAPFEDPNVGAVGGRILPTFATHVPEWMRGPHLNTMALADYGDANRVLGSADLTLPFGANMAFRRSALLHGGGDPFQISLGHTGALTLGWEEWHALWRVERSSRIAYAPDAIVDHHVDPERLTWARVRRTHFQNGFGHSRHEQMTGTRLPDRPRVFIRALRAYRTARALARTNGESTTATPSRAWEEFSTFQWAGKEIEASLAGMPRLAEWLAARLA